MIDIRDEHFKNIEDFKETINLYKSGKIDKVSFKAGRSSMGVYEQRTKETYMVRARIPGGVISLEQFKEVSLIAKKYSQGKIHITSRQDIQFHDVLIDDIEKIMKELINIGIITKGTGGNTVRNVACSPLSGVASDEIFDVAPYVREVTNYLIKDSSTMKLPRKYKIGFSNSLEDTINATVSDLGFIAKFYEGRKGFEVYGAGGLGGNPRVSLKLTDFIECKDVLYYVQAMKEIFEKEGDRTNRHKARIRFIVHRLGEESFIKLFNEQLKKVKNEVNLDINIDDNQDFIVDKSEENIVIEKEYENVVFPQKQKGYYSVYIHPQSGNASVEYLDKILNFLESLKYSTSIRITNTQAFFVRDLKYDAAIELLNITNDFSSKFNIDNSLTCSGSSICQLGLCLSQNLLIAIKEEFKNESYAVKAALPRLFISGCHNSCGQHQKGKIGLSGKAKKTEYGFVPLYAISFGGHVGAGVANLGKVFGDIPAKKVPKYLLELAKLKVNLEYDDFDKFLLDKEERIKKILLKYSSIEDFKENPELYYDFGSCERFLSHNYKR